MVVINNTNTYADGSYLQKSFETSLCPILRGLTVRRIAPCAIIFAVYSISIANVTAWNSVIIYVFLYMYMYIPLIILLVSVNGPITKKSICLSFFPTIFSMAYVS